MRLKEIQWILIPTLNCLDHCLIARLLVEGTLYNILNQCNFYFIRSIIIWSNSDSVESSVKEKIFPVNIESVSSIRPSSVNPQHEADRLVIKTGNGVVCYQLKV